MKEPVKFHVMGGTGEILDVIIVFLLAISDPKSQLELLKKLMNLLKNEEVLQKIAYADKENDIYDILKEN